MVQLFQGRISKQVERMPKHVLLHFSRQKRFVYARNILTICVFIAILLLLSLIIAFIAISPACQGFWKTSPIYEIYPLSFKDSDGDGKGDIKGITSKLDYLSGDLGVKTIVLKYVINPDDMSAVNPDLGTNDDVIELVTAVHEKRMYLVLELIPNHTSDKHPWFLASRDSSHADHDLYKDFYVWESTGSGTVPPNNWQSMRSSTGGSESAWKYDSTRAGFFYHAFEDSFPDLNFRNEKVRNEFKEILRFWLDLNLDGFRFSFINYVYESPHLRDQQLIDPTGAVTYSNMYPDFTKDLPEIHDLLMDWRSLLDEFSTEPGVYRFMETETDIGESSDVLTRYYGNEYTSEADLPFNVRLVELDSAAQWTGTRIGAEIVDWMDKMPRHKWANWRLGTSLSQRLLTRVQDDEQLARCAAVISSTLSGSNGIYYGEEIGMTSDPGSDDSQLSPMQWDSTGNAGFTPADATAWMDVNENYRTGTNVQEQLEDRSSVLHLYKKLISMRSELIFLRGSLCVVAMEEDFLAYVRELPGIKSVLIVINFSDADIIGGDYIPSDLFPQNGMPILYNSAQPNEDHGELRLSEFTMQPKQAMVIEYNPVTQISDDPNYSCYVSDPVCQNGIGLLQKC